MNFMGESVAVGFLFNPSMANRWRGDQGSPTCWWGFQSETPHEINHAWIASSDRYSATSRRRRGDLWLLYQIKITAATQKKNSSWNFIFRWPYPIKTKAKYFENRNWFEIRFSYWSFVFKTYIENSNWYSCLRLLHWLCPVIICQSSLSSSNLCSSSKNSIFSYSQSSTLNLIKWRNDNIVLWM